MSVKYEDLSSLKIAVKDQVAVEEVLGENYEVPAATELALRVFSEDLEGLIVECNNGLLIGLSPPPPGSFFNPTLSDDTNFTLRCPDCLQPYLPYKQAKPFLCSQCLNPSELYTVGITQPFWYCSSGMRLAIDKLSVRQERAPSLRVVQAGDMEAFLRSQDFVATLVDWLDYHVEPLKSNLQAWDLADRLELLWTGWKTARRPRRPGRRLSSFRALETAFSSEDWPDWTAYPHLTTGSRVAVKVPKVKPAVETEAPDSEDPA